MKRHRYSLLAILAAAVALVIAPRLSQAATAGNSTYLTTDPVVTQNDNVYKLIHYTNGTFPDASSYARALVDLGYTTNGTFDCYHAINMTCPTVSISRGSSSFRNVMSSSGESISINGGSHVNSGEYDAGPVGGGNNNTLIVNFSGLPAAQTNLVFYLVNDDSNSNTRTGCFSYADGSGSAGQCYSIASGNAELMEVTTDGSTSGTLYEYQSNNSGNIPFSAVFVGTGLTTAAPYSRLAMTTSHGVHTLRWYSTMRVLGFNVFDGKTKLNHRLITSKNHWYTFSTRHNLTHRRIVAVWPNGHTG